MSPNRHGPAGRLSVASGAGGVPLPPKSPIPSPARCWREKSRRHEALPSKDKRSVYSLFSLFVEIICKISFTGPGQQGKACSFRHPAGKYTPLVDGMAEQSDPENPERAIDAIAAAVPLGRLGTPEECGELCAFLASDESSYLTGTQVVIDGGSTLPETSSMGQ